MIVNIHAEYVQLYAQRKKYSRAVIIFLQCFCQDFSFRIEIIFLTGVACSFAYVFELEIEKNVKLWFEALVFYEFASFFEQKL